MKRLALPLSLLLIFLLALIIRLYDITDPPFDFHPTRQLRAAVIARGMYYEMLPDAPEPQKSIAIHQWKAETIIEPPILERIAALTYLVSGADNLWLPRALSSVFWLLGGIAVFKLAQSLANTGSALIAVSYFLFLPFSIIASRSFQPDPLMVALMAASFLMLYRWAYSESWRDALLAGVFAGLAVLTKLVAIFSIGLAALFIVISKGFRKSLRSPQVWTIAGLTLLPVLAYYFNGLYISGFLQGQETNRIFPALWIDPKFYIRWLEMASNITGLTVMLIGILGIFLARDKISRSLLIGMWAGYIIYGFNFPFHFITHDYYQLPLLPIAAISIAPAAGMLLDELGKRPYRSMAYTAFAALALGTILFKVWDTRVVLARKDFRSRADHWSQYEGILPADSSTISFAPAYGYPLAYYGWTPNIAYLNESDAEMRSIAGLSAEELEERRFSQFTGKDFFLITSLSEFNQQTKLQEYLYANFDIFIEGDGYLVFDLRQ